MASPGIPARVQASRALAGGQRYTGLLPFRQLPRLVPLLADTGGGLQVDLQAQKESLGGSWLRGEIKGSLPLTCQRGLHAFQWTCALPVVLRLVSSEAEEEKLLKDYEPYLIQDDQLPLRELVEDEVLLAMPMQPRCDDPDCLRRL